MEHEIYLKGIKNALKARGLTYADLASDLKMTESGIKKMLNSKDVSFRRLIQICDVLNILPGQLFTLSESSSIPVIKLSEKQEDALIKDRKLLAIYWHFTIEKKSFQDIAKLHGYNQNELERLFQKLVTLDLVNQKRGSFFPKHNGKFRWHDDSKIAKILNSEWSQLTLKKSLKPNNDGMHRLAAVKLSRKSYSEVLSSLTAAIDEAIQKSERDELTIKNDTIFDFTLLVATSDGVFSN